MLAIAGGVAWGGYLLFVYGLSQLAGQNYSIADLAIPGKFTLGNPAPDAKGTGDLAQGGNSTGKQQTGAANPVPSNGGTGPSGFSICYGPNGQSKPTLNGKCPQGWTLGSRQTPPGLA